MKNKIVKVCCDCGAPVSKKKITRCKACESARRTLTEKERLDRKLEIKLYKAEYFKKNQSRIQVRVSKKRAAQIKENPELMRRRNFTYFIRWKYGMELEDYEKMVVRQNGCCGICGHRPAEGARKENKLYVDHNHNTKRVRGLLCMNCNSAIGHFNEDLTTLKKAVEYIEINNQIDEKIGINSTNSRNSSDTGRG